MLVSPMYGIIYKITNTVNGKTYVGQTVKKMARRWQNHLAAKTGCRRLQSAISRYGAHAFAIEQLATAHSAEELNALETEWILKLGSHLPKLGYNLKLGGAAPRHGEETKRRIGASAKRRHENPDARAKISAGMKRYNEENPNARTENSERLKRYFESPEARAKMSAAYKLAKGTPQSRSENSARVKRYFENPEARAKASEVAKRHHAKHPERGTAHSATMKSLLSTPEAREKLSVLRKRTNGTPQARANNSAAQKKLGREKRIVALLQSQIARMDWT